MAEINFTLGDGLPIENRSGMFIDPDTHQEMSPLDAAMWLQNQARTVLHLTDCEDIGESNAGTMTIRVPWDLDWKPGKTGPPMTYAVAQRYVVRRFGRRPFLHSEWAGFASSAITAAVMQDQASAHVRTMVKHNRRWFRRIYWPPVLSWLMVTIAVIWLGLCITFGIITIIDGWAK